MPQPIWRKVVAELKVPQDITQQWTLALELVTPLKTMKIEVVIDTPRKISGEWTPVGFAKACLADGDTSGTARGTLIPAGNPLVASAPLGALIARIGGSTADLGPDTATPPATPARIVFSIGRECVFTVPATPTGSLYLGVNDDPTRMTGVQGEQVVNIYEAL